MTDDLAARLERLERRSRGQEARETMETAFWAIMRNVFPDETRRHLKAASREQLLAARSYLDHWIAKLGDESASEARIERETIEVE
ncbi:MAG TPA: hypothetical protein VI733_00380 [Candidatus Limnocylindria bacterium]|nr:hypothetical protein [Candidatus Limnocylindria bacterium]